MARNKRRTPFSWSHTRDKTFRECPRRLRHQYYTSVGAFDADASEETRLAFRLKKLNTVRALLGSQIHERAREIAESIRDGKPCPTLRESYEKTRDAMDEAWYASQDRDAFISQPSKTPMLYEVYYDRYIDGHRIRGLMQMLTVHLHSWPGWNDVRRCARENILLFDRKSIPFRGLPIWAIPDLAFRMDAASGWHLVDWKTGQEGPVDMQLALYGLFMSLKRFEGPYSGLVVSLGNAEERCVPIGRDEMKAAVGRIRNSVADMRELLIDGDLGRNEALPVQSFPAADDACGYCSFLELCHGTVSPD